jgi:Flp pilus assembly protein CpaB
MRAVLPFRGRNLPLLIAAGAFTALALMLSIGHGMHSHAVSLPRPAPPPPVILSHPAATDTGIAAQVAPGERAFSIRVAEDEIVGGFLQSGDRVDIFATLPGSLFPARNAQSVPDRSQTLLLLQQIQVLAVGETRATKGAVQSGARTVSLSLTPTALARLALAQRFGKISLAIRNPHDAVKVAPEHATLADLVPLPGHARGRSNGIPIYAGTHRGWSRLP